MRELWIDAQLSPAIAGWLPEVLGLPVRALRDLGLRDADDPEIFQRAKAVQAGILTKDADFLILVGRHGPPPRVIWLTCGNTTNAALQLILTRHGGSLRAWLADGELPLIEIR